jgi:cysteine desulfurase
MKKSIYLDHAAATPLDPKVLAVMQPYFAEKFHNPSALYLAAKAVAKDIAEARATVAHWLGVRPSEIVFTAGGTEANNLAIHGVMQSHPDGNLVVSAIEHDSVLRPAHHYRCQDAPVLPSGQIDLERLEKLIDDKTVLVSIMYANNEIGVIQNLTRIGQLLLDIRHKRVLAGNARPLYFHTDACQAANYLSLHARSLKVDLMTINGGKIYGPKQSGALFVSAHVDLQAQITGGGHEFGKRSGTENVPGIIGLAQALDIAQRMRKEETDRLGQLQALFHRLLAEEIPSTLTNALDGKLVNNVHITLPGQDNERLIMALDERGIQVAAGSACSASNEEPSHVLKAIGLTDAEAQASLRFTMGRSTDEAAIRRTVKELRSLVG